jgi:glycine/D-amino acid oxidase-like deaminating enzyme
MRRAEAIVIGGGVMGASIAYALTSRGLKGVLLLEREALASGASGLSSGLVRMHYTDEWNARLAWASFPTLRHWEDLIDVSPVFTRTGMVYLVGHEYAENLRKNVIMLQGIGVNTAALTPDDLQTLQPFMNLTDVGAAAYEPEAGYVNPADTVEGFRRRAQDLGATVRQWTPVTAILRHGDRVAGVQTRSETIAAPVVVVAAGAWTPRLLGTLGISFPVRVKGLDTAVVQRPAELNAGHLSCVDNVQGTYFRPDAGGLTIVGVPCQEWDLDPDTAAAGFRAGADVEAAQILTHRIPLMETGDLQRVYRAIDGYSPDRQAILDHIPEVAGLFVAAGFSGSGFKIAPAVGVCLAEWILQGAARTVDIRAFCLSRFAEGQHLKGPFPYAVRKDHVQP